MLKLRNFAYPTQLTAELLDSCSTSIDKNTKKDLVISRTKIDDICKDPQIIVNYDYTSEKLTNIATDIKNLHYGQHPYIDKTFQFKINPTNNTSSFSAREIKASVLENDNDINITFRYEKITSILPPVYKWTDYENTKWSIFGGSYNELTTVNEKRIYNKYEINLIMLHLASSINKLTLQ